MDTFFDGLLFWWHVQIWYVFVVGLHEFGRKGVVHNYDSSSSGSSNSVVEG